MDVRAGYKQTEVGVIPENWEVKTFAQLFAFRNGVNADRRSYGRGIRFINVLEPITYSHLYGPEIPGRVTLPDPIAASFAVRRGDVLFNRTSETQDEVGLAATYLGADPVVFGGFVIRGRPTDQCLNPTYSGYALRAPFVRSQIVPMGQGAIRANIGQRNLGLVVAPVPPYAEQCSIAEALSDADALIESLEQLLAKKRQIKQGAMQELLAGRKRLPEFEGNRGYKQTAAGVLPTDWNAGPIGRTIEKLEAGASVNSAKDEAPEFESYPCVLKTGAASGGLFHPRESKKVAGRDLWRLKVSVRRDTILISRMNTTELVGESGYVPRDYRNLFVPDRMWMATVRSTVSPRWLSYILTWRPVKSQISASATGTSGSMKNISKPSFRAVEIPYPPVEEQCAIAKVLSDFETEITNLAAKLVKAREIKQGMMQELLTGRIRLV
jgi:type I restriction enzyme, S subunit